MLGKSDSWLLMLLQVLNTAIKDLFLQCCVLRSLGLLIMNRVRVGKERQVSLVVHACVGLQPKLSLATILFHIILKLHINYR